MDDIHELLEYWGYEPPVHVSVAGFFGAGEKYARAPRGGVEVPGIPTEAEVTAFVKQMKTLFG